MAPIEHADSIIEESIVSTSPYRPEDTDDVSSITAEPTLPIPKVRVTKTYGKPKTDQNTDTNNTTYSSGSRAYTLRTAPPETERLVIPESEDTLTSGFNWRQQLKEIDNEFDGQAAVPSPALADKNQNDAMVNGSIFSGTLSPLPSQSSLSSLPVSTQIISTQTTEYAVDSHTPQTTNTLSNEVSRMSDSIDDGASPVESLDAGSAAEEDEQVDLGETSRNKQRRKATVKQKPKKASKKELTEMQKESARLLAERSVKIKRPDFRPSHTVPEFFSKLLRFSKNATVAGDSDPIRTSSSPDTFTSSQKPEDSPRRGVVLPVALRRSTPPKKQLMTIDKESESEETSDIELPTAESLLEEGHAKRAVKLAEELRTKELKERKLALMSTTTSTTDSDDDLEVEALVTPHKSSHQKSIKSSENAYPPSRFRRSDRDKQTSKIDLGLAAKPLFSADASIMAKSHHQGVMSTESLNQILLQRAEKQSLELEERKRKQWIEQGGSIKVAKPSEESSVESWIQKGLRQADRDDEIYDQKVEVEASEKDGDDISDAAEEESAEENDGMYDENNVFDEEDEDKENQKPILRRVRSRVVMDSDEENDLESAEPVVLVPDSSCPDDAHSFTVYCEDSQRPEYDDENKENMIYDYDTNEENTPFTTLGSSNVGRRSQRHLDEDPRQRIASPSSRGVNQSSRVLQVLHEEDKENTLASVYSSPSDEAAGLSFSASTELFEGSTLVSPENFTHIFANTQKASTNDEMSPSPLGPKGFSQFFSLSEPGIKKKSPVKRNKLDGSSALETEEFEFTQPNALLPAVRISESQRREVDNMFSKDQEFKLDEAKRVKFDAQPSDLIRSRAPYFGSFIASQAEISPIIRQPLATMSLTSMGDTQETIMESSPASNMTRLRRERPRGPSSSDTFKILDAFKILKDTSMNKSKKSVTRIDRLEFIEGEAQESDDEFYAGFGGPSKNQADEEEEDEDQDAIVEGLVDDAALDDKTLGEDLVLEKHKEFEAETDAALLKHHQDAIQGKFRIKRKNKGLEFEDSESEDEENGRPRKNFPKKRRIEGDTLEACAQNPETRAFFDAYQQPLLEDDEDQVKIKPAEHFVEKEDSEGMSEEMEDNDDIVGTSTLLVELRERALQDEESKEVRPDLEDVTWVDADELHMSDDVEVQVEQGVVLQAGKLGSRNTGPSTLQFSSDFMTNGASTQERTRLKAWASEESQSRSAGGRGGFSRKGHKDQSGPSRLHKYPTNNDSDNGGLKRPASSLITSVRKQKRFED